MLQSTLMLPRKTANAELKRVTRHTQHCNSAARANATQTTSVCTPHAIPAWRRREITSGKLLVKHPSYLIYSTHLLKNPPYLVFILLQSAAGAGLQLHMGNFLRPTSYSGHTLATWDGPVAISTMKMKTECLQQHFQLQFLHPQHHQHPQMCPRPYPQRVTHLVLHHHLV